MRCIWLDMLVFFYSLGHVTCIEDNNHQWCLDCRQTFDIVNDFGRYLMLRCGIQWRTVTEYDDCSHISVVCDAAIQIYRDNSRVKFKFVFSWFVSSFFLFFSFSRMTCPMNVDQRSSDSRTRSNTHISTFLRRIVDWNLCRKYRLSPIFISSVHLNRRDCFKIQIQCIRYLEGRIAKCLMAISLTILKSNEISIL